MKKVLSIVLTFALLLSFSGNLWMVAYAADGDITATVQGSYTKSDAEQDVTIRLELPNVNEAYCAFYIDTGIELPNGFVIKSFATSNTAVQIAAADYNLVVGTLNYDPVSSTNSIPANTYYDVVITAPAGASGNFTIKFMDVCATDSTYNNVVAEAAEVSTTLTIKEAPTVEGYTAGVSVTGSTVTVGDTVTVNVGVSHSSDTYYNAGEIVLAYDSEYLTLDTDSLGELKYSNANGVLTIEDFGANKNFSTSNYAITFNTSKVGSTTVELTSAAFIDKEDATTNDLIDAAALNPASVDITINEVTYAVTLPNDGKITGDSVATKGQPYTFTVDEPGNYTYDVTVTVGGDKIDTVIGPDANGQYTIPAASITDEIVITYTREAKTYSVRVEGEDKALIGLPGGAPTYGVDYTFTIPENTLPTYDSEGHTYTVTVTVNSEEYNPEIDGLDYTILGTDIVGDIVITIATATTPATPIPQVTVQISGSTDVKVNGATSVTVNEGSTVTLTLTREDGYNYSVVVGSGDPVSFDGNNQYQFVASANVTVTVTKTLNTDSAAIYEYVRVDNYVVWLVTFNPTLDSKVPTYGGEDNVMYWSDKYDAYCWLVIDSTLTLESAKGQLGAKTGAAEDKKVDYGMDINGTTTIDAADAQVVWNMYNAMYNDNFTSVTMAQFLAADQNAVVSNTETWKLNVQDAQTIVAAILNGTAK